MRHMTAIAAMLFIAGPFATGCGKKKEETAQTPKETPNTAPKTETPVAPPKSTVKPIPEGFFSVTPVLTVDDVDAALAFYEANLGAKKRYTLAGPDGKPAHAEMIIGDSIIMLEPSMDGRGTKSPKALGGTNGSLMVYVDDADKTFATATAAGATVEMPLMDAFWGDRYGRIIDPFGHSWGIATHKEDVSPEQMRERAEAFIKDPKSVAAVIAKNPGKPAAAGSRPEGYHTVVPALVEADGAKAIEFYEKAFGAKQKTRMDMPDGSLMHAEIVIGDSIIMIGSEQPAMAAHKAPSHLGGTPLTLMLYVEDADKVFAQAVAAGATVKDKLQDAFWGDRFGMVTDPEGHVWGIGTHKEDLTPEQINERMKAAFQKGAGAPPDQGTPENQ